MCEWYESEKSCDYCFNSSCKYSAISKHSTTEFEEEQNI